ncbi:hypothetical protein AVEN_212475-1 [Araneus ventricosus]|uniref:Uncharacterized protein n=1 Tax=Araneus ventricosus TaxID=182803 RepID=A0A4Y2QH92_ARAVE|nr:hypothetical protein AVEN_212475-1 [Araneus ventricosus]
MENTVWSRQWEDTCSSEFGDVKGAEGYTCWACIFGGHASDQSGRILTCYRQERGQSADLEGRDVFVLIANSDRVTVCIRWNMVHLHL